MEVIVISQHITHAPSPPPSEIVVPYFAYLGISVLKHRCCCIVLYVTYGQGLPPCHNEIDEQPSQVQHKQQTCNTNKSPLPCFVRAHWAKHSHQCPNRCPKERQVVQHDFSYSLYSIIFVIDCHMFISHRLIPPENQSCCCV